MEFFIPFGPYILTCLACLAFGIHFGRLNERRKASIVTTQQPGYLLPPPHPLVWVDSNGVHHDPSHIRLTDLEKKLIWVMHRERGSKEFWWTTGELHRLVPEAAPNEIFEAMTALEAKTIIKSTYHAMMIRFCLRTTGTSKEHKQ